MVKSWKGCLLVLDEWKSSRKRKNHERIYRITITLVTVLNERSL